MTSEGDSGDGHLSGWLRISDDLLWGFNHELSNRLAAVNSIARIIEYSDTGLDPLLTALAEEIHKLERSLALLRLVPRDPEAVDEPVVIASYLEDLLDAHRLRADYRDLSVRVDLTPDLMPLWIEPHRLGHLLLAALAIVSRAWLEGGSQGEMILEVTGDDREIRVGIGLLRDAAAGGLGGGDSPERALLDVLTREARGSVEEVTSSTGRQLVIRLPTLLAARERGR
jgi:hypothetical protein